MLLSTGIALLGLFWPSINFNKFLPILEFAFPSFLKATCDVARGVVDVDKLALVVTEETDKLEVNAPSPLGFDNDSDRDVPGPKAIKGKSNFKLQFVSFPDKVS